MEFVDKKNVNNVHVSADLSGNDLFIDSINHELQRALCLRKWSLARLNKSSLSNLPPEVRCTHDLYMPFSNLVFRPPYPIKLLMMCYTQSFKT